MDIDEYLASLDGQEDVASIEDALKDIDLASLEEETPTDKPEDEPEPSPEDKPEPTPEPTTEPEKKPQTSEDNARFAEQRRQKQAEERAKAELERLKQEDPAFRVAKKLSELYNQPIEVIEKQLEEARLAEEAKRQNVPVELLRQREADAAERARLQDQINRLSFQAWKGRVDSEAEGLKKEYPMLTDDDLNSAKEYMLTKLSPDSALEEAVQAIHGKKIIQGFREIAKNEALAEVAGRKKGALPPQGGAKATDVVDLTADEKYVAKQMGLSEEEYAKWKLM